MRTTGGSSGSGSVVPAVLTDFDDTAAVQNVAQLLLDRFGDPTWPEVRSRFRSGELTLKEYQEITFRNIRSDRPAMEAYVKKHANLRPFFRELWGYCRTHGIPMAVVSLGLDFYIQALLNHEECPDVPVHAVTTGFTPQGLTYEYSHVVPGQERQGNSKGLVLDQYRERGHYIVYVGDGVSDFEPAAKADLLFAHRTLAKECTRQGIPFEPFTDFRDVLLALQEHQEHQADSHGRQMGGSRNRGTG